MRIVWITMLAAMGSDYMVRASTGGLAHQARVSREDCERALEVLSSPDSDSRSTENEGRRILRVEGGFLILNGGKYREARSQDERKMYMAEYMRNYRKQCVNNSKQNVNSVSRSKPQLAQAEAEAEAEAEKSKTASPVKLASAKSEDWISELKKLPAYEGIDIDRELSKMDAWLMTPRGKGKKKTKGFVVNWLNKIDAKEVKSNGHYKPSSSLPLV